MAGRLQLRMGLKHVAKPKWPSEPGYVASMNAQIEAWLADIQDIFDQILYASPEIMLDAVYPIYNKARNVYCPVDTGALRDSAYAEATGRGKNPRVEVGFAKGGSPRYAVYVHEMVEQYHEPPTRSKFLQAALMEDLDGLKARLEAGYKEFTALG
jgi:hypothetical protein